jgi:hypothetical protein
MTVILAIGAFAFPSLISFIVPLFRVPESAIVLAWGAALIFVARRLRSMGVAAANSVRLL